MSEQLQEHDVERIAYEYLQPNLETLQARIIKLESFVDMLLKRIELFPSSHD